MQEAKILIDYAELSGFSLTPNGNKLTVNNGAELPTQLKKFLIIHKDDIINILNEKEVIFN